jgi:regulator of protease activity HflC (stomatin/prohibitin superfamily)
VSPELTGIAVALAILIAIIVAAVRIVDEYERGVIFRLGRVIGAKGPGLFFIIPIVDRMVKVNLQTITMDIPPQDIITKDNVTIRVNAVTYFNVTEPVNSVIKIQNYVYGTSQIAQTTLRSVIGGVELDELLINREAINATLQEIIDGITDEWGVKVTLVEVKDVELPESMRRAMARQAEAERDRRAKVIHAEGEFNAAKRLSEAAQVMATAPGAMQLRLLSTLSDVTSEKNSTLVFPVPIELLRFVERLTPGGGGGPEEGDRYSAEGATAAFSSLAGGLTGMGGEQPGASADPDGGDDGPRTGDAPHLPSDLPEDLGGSDVDRMDDEGGSPPDDRPDDR